MSETNPFQDLANALATAHREMEALNAKLSESEAKVRELEAALLDYVGDIDDPHIGWRGQFPSTPNHFKCEMCGQEHLDCTLIPHMPSCRVAALLRVLLGVMKNDVFKAMGLPDLPPFPSIDPDEARKKGAEHGE